MLGPAGRGPLGHTTGAGVGPRDLAGGGPATEPASAVRCPGRRDRRWCRGGPGPGPVVRRPHRGIPVGARRGRLHGGRGRAHRGAHLRRRGTAASVSASSVRRGLSAKASSEAVADALDLSDEDARVVAAALTGRRQHSLTCQHGGADDEEPDRLNRVGLTAAPRPCAGTSTTPSGRSGWAGSPRGREQRAHARLGALRGSRRGRVLPAGDQAQPRQGVGHGAVPRGPRGTAEGRTR